MYEQMARLLRMPEEEQLFWLKHDLCNLEAELELPGTLSVQEIVEAMARGLVKNRLHKVEVRRWFRETRQLEKTWRCWSTINVLTKMERAMDKKKESPYPEYWM